MNARTQETVYRGEDGFTKGIAAFNRRDPEAERDHELMSLWADHTIEETDTLVFHAEEDAMGRVWTATIGSLRVERIRPTNQEDDLVFYGAGIPEGMLAYFNARGDDPLLSLLNLSCEFKEGDRFTMHCNRDLKHRSGWTLETDQYHLIKKPKA